MQRFIFALLVLGSPLRVMGVESGRIVSASPSTFSCGQATTVTVQVQNTGDSDDMILEADSWPSGWSVSPKNVNPYMSSGSYYNATFTVTPPAGGGSGAIVWKFYDDDIGIHPSGSDLLAAGSQSVSATGESVSTPSTPTGPSSGQTGQSLSYSTGGATSSCGHSIQYRFDWGDGTYSTWSSSTSASKSWSTATTYTVRAQARCATHTATVSSVSAGKSVVISPPPPVESGRIVSASPSTFSCGQATTVTVQVQNTGESDDMIIEADSWPSGWSVTPKNVNPYITSGSYYNATFTVTPPAGGGSGTIVWKFYDDDIGVHPTGSDLLAAGSQSVSATGETISIPNTHTGPSSGETGQSLSYSTGGATSSCGHGIEYRFDWGDGTYSAWSSSASASKSWGTASTYTVRAQARCATHTSVVSSWSGGKSVVISPPPPVESGRIVSVSPSTFTGGQATTVTVQVQNTGEGDDMIIEADSWPSGWSVTPKNVNPYITSGSYYNATFTVTPPAGGGSGMIVWKFYDDDIGIHPSGSDLLATYNQPVSAINFDPYGVGALEPSGIGLFSTIPAENRNNLTDLANLKNNGLYYGARLVNSTDRKLIIAIHGWSGTSLTSISDAINTAISGGEISADWRVIAYDWSQDADTGITDAASKTNELELAGEPLGRTNVEPKIWFESGATQAAERAYQHGLLIGAKILQQVGAGNLQAVHLVGHSAGSWAVYGALRYLYANAPSTTLLQASYLDPYIPADVPFNVNPNFTRAQQESSPNYCRVTGQFSVKAEQYWAGDITLGTDTAYSFTSQPSVVFRTDGFPYGDANWDGHGGPIVFYVDTINSPDHSQASGHGWKHSLAYNADLTPPTVTISSPTSGQTLTSSPITVSGSASDPGSPSSGVVLVEVRVNSGAWQTASGTTSWSRSVSLSSGSNLIEARSRDNAGNYSTIPSVSVTYNPPDTTVPTVAITSPTSGQIFTSSPITVSGSASDPGSPSSGVALVEVRVNGGSWQTASGTTSWNRSVSLASGSNTIEARSRDNAGNYSSIPSVTVTYNPLDTTLPTVSISSPTSGQTFTSTPITVSGTASDPGSPSSGLALVEVRVNSGAWQTASGTASWNSSVSLSSGSNLIEARSRDNAGNYSTIPSVSVTYNPSDTTAPTVVISSPTSGQTFISSPVTVSGSASDPGSPSSGLALVEVRVSGGAWQTASGTASWNSSVSLSSGSNLIEARSQDNAGIYSTIASVSVTYSSGTNPPPQLTGMVLSNGVFRFVLNGPVGSNYVIQASSNLVNWVPLSTNTIPAGGWVLITDQVLENQPRRFYRAVLNPNRISVIASASSTMIQNRRATWLDAWSASVATGNPTLSPNRVGLGAGRNDSDGLCAVERPFIVFSLPTLPSGAQIVSAELVLSIQRKNGAVNDNWTYFRVLRGSPANPANIVSSDFGLVSTNNMYSDKHFFLDIIQGQDLVVPLTANAFPALTSNSNITFVLMNGHELENVDHFSVINAHNHSIYAPDTPGQNMPQLRITYTVSP